MNEFKNNFFPNAFVKSNFQDQLKNWKIFEGFYKDLNHSGTIFFGTYLAKVYEVTIFWVWYSTVDSEDHHDKQLFTFQEFLAKPTFTLKTSCRILQSNRVLV